MRFNSASAVVVDPLEPRRLLASNGLNAVYFDNSNFTGRSYTRIDRVPSLALTSTAAPAPGLGHTTFSVRWNGLIVPYTSETYTFITRNADGVRLWVNGKLIIDSWKAGPTTTRSGSISLKANRLYDLRLEHYTGKHNARMSLAWSTPSGLETVPANRLLAYDTRSANVGDYGRGNSAEGDVAGMIHGWKPDFITTVGDNNYPSGSSSTIDRNIGKYFSDYIGDYKGSYGPGAETNAFFPVLGNHDWDTSGAKPYKNYFTLPGNERYYDFVRGSVHFFALDSDSNEPDGNSSTSDQAQWLKSELQNASEPFKVVYFHDPPYSSGTEGNVQEMRWPFSDWGADVVLNGSDHFYERLEIDGIPYIVNGAGSSTIDPVKIRPETIFGDNSDKGALLIQANEYALTFQYEHRSGEVIDTLTIPVRGGTAAALPQQRIPASDAIDFAGPLPFWSPLGSESQTSSIAEQIVG